jgi:hypothetical protein
MREFGWVGYMVITLPSEFWQKDREFLQKFRRYTIRKLKRMGIKVGKCRFHWAGDKNRVFYPHLNILMASGWLGPEVLTKLKQDIAKHLGYNGLAVIDYHYSKSIKQIVHWVKYICRPTLNLIENHNERWSIWDNVVKGFMNDVEWGDLRDAVDDIGWDLEALDMVGLSVDDKKLFWLFLGRCPYCRQKLKWRRIRDGDLKDVIYQEVLDCGYKELII